MVTVGIVAKLEHDGAQALAERLADRLSGEGVDVVLDETTATALGREGRPVPRMADRQLLVTLGGDGTLLFAVRESGGVPVIGVNFGEVGFVNALEPGDALEVLPTLIEQIETTGTVPGVDRTRVIARGEGWSLPPALNEVAILGRRAPGVDAAMSVTVDGEGLFEGVADGVIVATPTGSSAYSLAEGGPLVQPGTEVLLVVPMAPSVATAPVVVESSATVTVTVEDGSAVVAMADGRTRQPLECPATVTVERAEDPVRLADPQPGLFEGLDALRKVESRDDRSDPR